MSQFALLSGGVDSSIIATLLSQINKNIDTFTVKFDNSEYDNQILLMKYFISGIKKS